MQIGQRIRYYRKKRGMTQEQLAEKVGVSFQTISSWENDEYLPQLDKVETIANALSVTIADLCAENTFEAPEWQLKDQIFNEEHMYKFIKAYAGSTGAKNTMAALPYAKKMHEGQYRKGPGKIPYIVHPLHMACHALALGLNEDELIATILLHDVCEDCKDEEGNPIPKEALPVSDAVKEAVALVTKPSEEYKGWHKDYYGAIKENRLATITKVLDRCNNISMMATGFSKQKMTSYITATETYVVPLLDVMKRDYADTCYNAAFLIKYQILSLLETLKRLL